MFLEENFDTQQSLFRTWIEMVKSLYEQHVEELELAETRLRMKLDSFASERSNEMAERSIAESKRMILGASPFNLFGLWIMRRRLGCAVSMHAYAHMSAVTALAFIFLPVSLAASVYGMV
jgi:hypothetical protein